MTTLKVGIADYEEMKARTLRIARGEERPSVDDPRVWFTSTESFAKVLSAGNRELLRVIVEKAPGSLDELSELTGRAKSNLSRTLKTMAGYGLVRLERGERGRMAPKVVHDRVALDLPLTGLGSVSSDCKISSDPPRLAAMGLAAAGAPAPLPPRASRRERSRP